VTLRGPLPSARAQQAEIKRRYSRRRPPKPQRVKSIRRVQVLRLLHHRYGEILPNDESGRAALQLLLELGLTGPEALRRAPWAQGNELDSLIDAAENNWPAWAKGTSIPKMIAQRLAVTFEEKTTLALHHIGCIDASAPALEADRRNRRRRRARERAAAKRAARNATPRDLWLARSLSQTKPWQTEGVSRRTWYRRRKTAAATDGTGASPGNLILSQDYQPVPRSCLTVRQPTCATPQVRAKPRRSRHG